MKKQVGLEALRPYLPSGSFDRALAYIKHYKVQLTLTRKRATVLGDYRHAAHGKGHRISVNSDLNPYAFLITLLHEVAHLVTFEEHGHKVSPHGREWKNAFAILLKEFVHEKIFPPDVTDALRKSLKNASASSCGDEHLLRTLKKYDPQKNGVRLLEELAEGETFRIAGGREFIKGPQAKKRYTCREVATNKLYLFSPVYEVITAKG